MKRSDSLLKYSFYISYVKPLLPELEKCEITSPTSPSRMTPNTVGYNKSFSYIANKIIRSLDFKAVLFNSKSLRKHGQQLSGFNKQIKRTHINTKTRTASIYIFNSALDCSKLLDSTVKPLQTEPLKRKPFKLKDFVSPEFLSSYLNLPL